MPPQASAAPPALAPFERPAGHRGIRGRLAAIVALATLPVVFVSRWPYGGSGSASGGWLGYAYSYAWGRPPLRSELALLGLALVLAGAAAGLWRARSRGLIATAALVALAAGGSVVILRVTAGDGRASAAAINGLPGGTSRAAALGRLGEPLATTQARPTGAGPVLDCLVYLVTGASGAPAGPVPYDPRAAIQPVFPRPDPTVLCFLHGRLVHRGGP